MTQIAIIGYGKMGKFYDNAIHANYIVDIYPVENRKYFDTIENFLKQKLVLDLVIVSTPTHTHYNIVKILLENNYNVLVEKPICLIPKEAKILESLAKKKNLILYQSTLERYNPVISFLKKNLDFSTVKKIESYRFGIKPNRGRQEDPVYDLGIHDVDLYFYLANKKIPWTIEVKYSDAPRREIILHLTAGQKITCDLANKQIVIGNKCFDLASSSQNNPMAQMVQEILFKGNKVNELWSKEIKILERFNNNKIKL